VTRIDAVSRADDAGSRIGLEAEAVATRSVKLETAVLLVGILVILFIVTATIGAAPPG
jgi:hypothetical protein